VTEPRLDVWLAADRSVTRHAARTMIDAGFVTVNGRRGRPGQRVRTHDVIVVVAEQGGAQVERDRLGGEPERLGAQGELRDKRRTPAGSDRGPPEWPAPSPESAARPLTSPTRC
jgi:ribosomal 50S subunit-recycling heat shock protein